MNSEYINAKLSLMGGAMIAISAAVYLISDNKLFGAIMFSVGFLIILSTGLQLCTGSFGFWDKSMESFGALLSMFMYNYIGAFLIGHNIAFVKPELISKAAEIVISTNATPFWTCFISALLCGVLIFLANLIYHGSYQDSFVKHVLVAMIVGTFVLIGFEHCITSVAYYGMAILATPWQMGLSYLLRITVFIIGNFLGALAAREMYMTHGKDEE